MSMFLHLKQPRRSMNIFRFWYFGIQHFDCMCPQNGTSIHLYLLKSIRTKAQIQSIRTILSIEKPPAKNQNPLFSICFFRSIFRVSILKHRSNYDRFATNIHIFQLVKLQYKHQFQTQYTSMVRMGPIHSSTFFFHFYHYIINIFV